MTSKKKEMTPNECLDYMNKIKEQTRLRQQRYIEKKKANGEYEAFNEAIAKNLYTNQFSSTNRGFGLCTRDAFPSRDLPGA